ncbi:hypothetical protein Smic_34970 [Streptomyces microflavus]|uniref:Uncharacterized protein n=1 Tax=Streptomyces microflavus TaxID=1919 RepID=A0A7J0CR16_STRMI|nr:hypothetical protein Smic_34970 [Streptomyces microflavus]
MDEFVIAVYERALGRGAFDPARIAEELGVPPHRAEQAVGVLRELRLVKPAEGGTDRLVAVSPEAAQMELLVPLEREILDSRHRLAGFKGQLSSFVAAFEKQARTRTEPVVITGDQEEIELRLLEAAQSCTTEVLVMQPCVARETRELRLARPLVLEALRRGARGRILYPIPRAAIRGPARTSVNSCPRGAGAHHQGSERPLPGVRPEDRLHPVR